MLTANYQLGWATLTSTSMVSFSRSMQDFAAAVDLATEASFQARGWAGLYPLGGTSTNAKDQTLYQDFHLTGDVHDGALQWLTGVEFLAQDDTYVRDVVTTPCTVTATSGICGGTPTQPICYKLIPTAANCPATIVAAYGGHRVVPSEYRSAAIYGSLKYDVGPGR
jgi:iron complex outermembrane receptor protein